MTRVVFWIFMVCLALTQAFFAAHADDSALVGYSLVIAFLAASMAILAALRFLRSAR